MKESIFKTAFRAFFKSFASILGIAIALILAVVGLSTFSGPDIHPPKSAIKISPDADGNRDLLPGHAPVILRLNIHGVIGMGDLTAAKIKNSLLDSREGLLGHGRVKAVFLDINTPGGAADDSDSIYQALMHYKKTHNVPIYAFVDGLCASGGMYIASSADQIFATAPSIIGSVGVIMGPAFNFSGLMQRYGVEALTISQGKDKDMLSPYRPWKPGEDAPLKTITADLYERFVTIVADARPKLTKKKLIDEYGARIYVSEEAQKLGYIDHANSSYSEALKSLSDAAKLEDTSYQVFTIGPLHPFLSELAEGKLDLLQGKISHELQLGNALPKELEGKFLYLYHPL